MRIEKVPVLSMQGRIFQQEYRFNFLKSGFSSPSFYESRR